MTCQTLPLAAKRWENTGVVVARRRKHTGRTSMTHTRSERILPQSLREGGLFVRIWRHNSEKLCVGAVPRQVLKRRLDIHSCSYRELASCSHDVSCREASEKLAAKGTTQDSDG